MDNAIEPPHARTARDLNSAIEASPGGASTSTLPLERRSSKAAQILNALAAADSATAERSDAEVDRTTPRALTPVAVDADATGMYVKPTARRPLSYHSKRVLMPHTCSSARLCFIFGISG